MTTFPLGVCAVVSSSSSSASETSGSSAYAWILNHVGAVFHDNFENGHREPGKVVNDTYSGILLVDNRCSFDSWCWPTAVRDEFVCRPPKGRLKVYPSVAHRKHGF